MSALTVLTCVALVRVQALAHAVAVGADVVHGAFGVNTAPFAAAVVHAGLTCGALVIDAATGRTLTLTVAELTLWAALVVSTARNALTVLVADGPNLTGFVAPAAVHTLTFTADLVVWTTRCLDATRHAEVVSAQLA